MKKMPCSVLTLLLALFVAVGASLAVVQQSDMAVKMAVSMDADEKCPHGSDGCPDGDDCNIAVCCESFAFTLCPAIASVNGPAQPDLFPFVQYAPRDGPNSIEPHPPKIQIFV
jgi:hypothetical protein